jgi:hypothetical protein
VRGSVRIWAAADFQNLIWGGKWKRPVPDWPLLCRDGELPKHFENMLNETEKMGGVKTMDRALI